MTRKVRQIRLRKDYFRTGYWSVHDVEYKDGEIAYEVLVDYTKKKSDARKIRNLYKKRLITNWVGGKY